MYKTFMNTAIKLVRRHFKIFKWKEKVGLCSRIGSFNRQMSNVPKLICRFNTIEVKIPAGLSREPEHLI